MFSYLGIDNLQKGKLVLVCKTCSFKGAVREDWREIAADSTKVSSFFGYITRDQPTLTFATTYVSHDPGGVLAQHKLKGGRVIRYRELDLGPARSTTPRIYRRAEQLVTKILHDEQFPLLVGTLEDHLKAVDSKMLELLRESRMLHEQIRWLRDQHYEEIPF